MMSAIAEQSSVAVWTPPGRGAVATIRVCGNLSNVSAQAQKLWHAANGRVLAELPTSQMCFGRWGRDSTEDVVVCRLSGNSFEIHCHGGVAAERRIVSDLIACGCLESDWKSQCGDSAAEMSSGWQDPEFLDLLSRAKSLRAAAWIASQAGRMPVELDRLEQLHHVNPDAAKRDAERHLSWFVFGRHLTSPWSVAVVGRPNVGKSSLINALVGYDRSIVFDQPGTTRDIVTVETAWDGWAVQLSDTAGDRESDDVLESSGIALARAKRSASDLTILVLDRSEPPSESDARLLSECPNGLIVANKSDLPDHWQERLPVHSIVVSSQSRSGFEQLTDAVVKRLVPRLPTADDVLPLSEKHVQRLQNILNR